MGAAISDRQVLAGGIIDTDFFFFHPVRTRVFYCSDRINQTKSSRVYAISSQAKGDIPPANRGKAIVSLNDYKLGEQLTCLLRQPHRAFGIEIFPDGSRPRSNFHWNNAWSKTIMGRAAVKISRYSHHSCDTFSFLSLAVSTSPTQACDNYLEAAIENKRARQWRAPEQQIPRSNQTIVSLGAF